MELLVFAHRGEAQAFLSQINFKAIDDNKLQLFESDKVDLLITGEGYLEALKATLLCLVRKKYQCVRNFGIAGALSPKLSLDQVYSIRTVYRYFNETAIFKSYTTDDESAIYDCTTFNKRVLNPEDARNLKVHADLVDRELWGIAEACQLFQLPFNSYKLISDIAGSTDCQLVANKSIEYTYKLFDYYTTLAKSNPDKHNRFDSETQNFLKNLSPTFSQRVQLEKLLKKCQLKSISIQSFYYLEQYEGWPRKRRNQDVIKRLTAMIDPIQSKLDDLCTDFSSLHLRALPHTEAPKVELRASIETKQQLKQLIKEIQSLDLDKLVQFYEGEF